jgi:HEAT repeat protein
MKDQKIGHPGETSSSLREVVELLKKMASYDRTEPARAYQELQKLDRERLIDTLSSILSHQGHHNPEIRYRAAEVLVKVDPERGRRLILPYLGSPDSVLRWLVCGLLSNHGDETATMPLVSVLRDDPEPRVRMLAAFALGKVGDERAIPALEWAREHDDGTDWEGRRVSDSAADAIEEISARYSD